MSHESLYVAIAILLGLAIGFLVVAPDELAACLDAGQTVDACRVWSVQRITN